MWLVGLGVLALTGCGGGPTRMVDSAPRVDEEGPDVSAMRALLDRYSPTGSWIVRSDDTLPRRFTVGGRTITLTSRESFASYFTDDDPDRLVDQMSTAVHEAYHVISTRLGYQLLVEAKAPALIRVEGVYTGGAPLLVEYSATYPAREMAASFPADAVTLRFATYVSPSAEQHGTQVDGVFGLLDEWAAYFHSGRTIVDFWPWVRDVAPRTRKLYTSYRSRFHGMWVAYAELKLFILHYLVHARTHRPDVYRGLVENASFRRAFVATDDAWTELLAAAGALEPAIVAIAAERGAANTIFHLEPAYPAVQRVLATEPYQRALAELRGR
jgi:hypothetical protein